MRELIKHLEEIMEAVGELDIIGDVVLLEAYLSIKDAIAALEKRAEPL